MKSKNGSPLAAAVFIYVSYISILIGMDSVKCNRSTMVRNQEAARQAQLAPNYFSKCFRKTTGSSFQAHLLELRLGFAKALLQSSTLPVIEISGLSGLNTLNHFENMFKRRFGQSPSMLRKANRLETK